MSWEVKQLLRERLAEEKGYYLYPLGVRSRFALVYPNSYFVGMSNLGFHIIYDLLNRRDDTFCERFFLPDKEQIKLYNKTNTPLLSLETQSMLADFSLIGFAVSFEMDYFNILEILRMGKIQALAEKRGEKDPLIIAGGPCATFNPEPLSPFIDAFIIGEGEETMQDFLDRYYESKAEGKTRQEILADLAKIPGVYVPAFYEHHYNNSGELERITVHDTIPDKVCRRWVKNLDDYPAHTVVITDNTEFRLYLIETARGCGRHCRFCMAGYCFRKPRNRSLRVLKEELSSAKQFNKRIGLMGAAISDYPEIDSLCEEIISQGMTMSVASFRADSVTETLVSSLANSGMKTLTIAPEAGSPRMRAVINKGIEEKHIFKTIDIGLSAGIKHFRLYIMVGLPYETMGDIEEIITLVEKIRSYMAGKISGTRVTVSVNPFVPKPFTPFQWLPMADKKTIEAIYKRLMAAFKGKTDVELLTESVKEAIIQALLARGDRRVGEALYIAHQKGGVKSFKAAVRELNIDSDQLLYRNRKENEVFPWDVLDMGVKREYLFAELDRAQKALLTPRCFDGCHRCGVCEQ